MPVAVEAGEAVFRAVAVTDGPTDGTGVNVAGIGPAVSFLGVFVAKAGIDVRVG